MSEGQLLEGKVCLVTGAGRGIGQKIAERFAKEGGFVYAGARQEGSLENWADAVNTGAAGKVSPIYFDITDTAAVKQAVVRIKKEQGMLDVLVNNAGIVHNGALGMVPMDKVREMFEVNVFGLLELSQLAATRLMMKQKRGSIVNIASIVGVEGSRGQVAYSASKGAVIAMTKSMAQELAPYQVRVNAVAPGMVDTERLHVEIREEYRDNLPPIGMGRLGKAEDIADACLYFASDMAAYTTGQIMVVGGGYDTQSRSLFHIEYR